MNCLNYLKAGITPISALRRQRAGAPAPLLIGRGGRGGRGPERRQPRALQGHTGQAVRAGVGRQR